MKKAQSGADTIFAIATIFGLVVFCLIAVFTYDAFVESARNTTWNDTPQAMQVLDDVKEVNEMWDYVIFFIFIGFAIAMVVLGYFVPVETIFFPIYIIVMLIGVLISAVLSYVWSTLITTADIFTSVASNSFPIMSHIMDNFVLYYVIIAVIGLTVTFAKTKEGI